MLYSMYVHLVIFLRAYFTFHISLCTLLYFYYFKRFPLNLGSMLNFLLLKLLDIVYFVYVYFCILKLFSAGSHSIELAWISAAINKYKN